MSSERLALRYPEDPICRSEVARLLNFADGIAKPSSEDVGYFDTVTTMSGGTSSTTIDTILLSGTATVDQDYIYIEESEEWDIFIRHADDLVYEVLQDEAKELGAIFRTIRVYLAAHFAALAYERTGFAARRRGQSEEEYNEYKIRSTAGLLLTRFGQQAVALDHTGKLNSVTNPMRATFKVIPAKMR